MPRGGARSRSGPPPKPTALKILEGNPGRRPINLNEPKPPLATLKPPTWLDADGRRVWRQLAPGYHALGLLTELGVEAFAHACAKLATARREQGTSSKALDQAERLLARFGWTPSDLSRLSVEKPTENKFDRFLKERQPR